MHTGPVYSRASASHCTSPGSSLLTICFLFPRLISNPNVAGGGVITRIAPISQSLSRCSGMLRACSTSLRWLPRWRLAGSGPAGREERSVAAPGVPRALSWQVAPLSRRAPKAALRWQPPAPLAAAPNTTDSNSKPEALPASAGLLGNALTLKSHVVVILILGKRRGTNCVSTMKLLIALQ